MNAPVFRKLPLLLCLMLLAPGASFAAGEPSPPPLYVPGTDTDDPHSLVEEEVPASRSSRVLSEVFVGTLTGAVLGLGGGLVGGGLCGAFDLGSGLVPCVEWLFAGFYGGLVAGMPLGVWWTGERMGGDGRLSSAFLGMVLGTAAGVLAYQAAESLSPSQGANIVPLFVFPLAGSIIGYEWSQRATASARLAPSLAVTSRGMMMGLGGHF